VHVGDKNIIKAAHSPRPGLKVCKGAVVSLPVGLHEAVDI